MMTTCRMTLMLAAVICFLPLPLSAQRAQTDDAARTGSGIWAVKTNALEWLLTIPNISAEFDLSGSPYNRHTIGLTAKYNWNTFHRYTPSCTFDLLDIRPEYRFWFRTKKVPSKAKGASKNTERRFYHFLSDRSAPKGAPSSWEPKSWRAHYVGIYADYSRYAFKFTPEGIQGTAYGVGISLGYGIPLYQYNKVAVDFELGCSLGLVVTDYDRFAYDSQSLSYYQTGHKNLHLTPFPVISELRATFAFRSVSIKDKYTGDDPDMLTYYSQVEIIRENFKQTTKANFDDRTDPVQREAYMADQAKYVADFKAEIDNECERQQRQIDELDVSEKYRKRLRSEVDVCGKKCLADFQSELNGKGVKDAKDTKDTKDTEDAKDAKEVKEKKEKKEKKTKTKESGDENGEE